MSLLKTLRKNTGMSQHELAYRAGLHQSSISLLERNYVRLTRDKAERIARVLECRIDFLVETEDRIWEMDV